MSGPTPVLVAFAGLPGTGKTTLARALAIASGATVLRVDTVEQAIRSETGHDPGAAGYGVVQALAAENLDLGRDVLVDSVNASEVSRAAFATIARLSGARLIDVEIVCTNIIEHRRRVETRRPDPPGLLLPDWDAVLARPIEPWTTPRIILDTARRSVGQAVALLLAQMDL